ncbi:anti-sigma factor [Salimicrobium sp. PL1-032A]|uniref:anti-sigma factor n=1 Tax=Salimicrobium sp. PL1-032A TaxID=3095364 RepID=UPI00325FEC07
MNCEQDIIYLMHKYLDEALTDEEQRILSNHLQKCEGCQKRFHELKRTDTLIADKSGVTAPASFTDSVMSQLPEEKKRAPWLGWFRHHPLVSAAAVFMLLMISGIFSAWNQDQQVTVSKQEGVVIEDGTVVVPEDVTVEGDLVVRNGDLKIEGHIDGDVTLINGRFLDGDTTGTVPEGENLQAYVSGELNYVNQVFEWVWYHMKNFAGEVFSIQEKESPE